jgi:hypothetical protein
MRKKRIESNVNENINIDKKKSFLFEKWYNEEIHSKSFLMFYILRNGMIV